MRAGVVVATAASRAVCERRAIGSWLQGVNVKTRKRNVAVPLDPAKFASDVLTLFKDATKDKEDVADKLAAAGKSLDGTDLDFSRYGVTLFEIYFAGARMGVGAKLADDAKEQLDWNVRAAEPRLRRRNRDFVPSLAAREPPRP